MHTHSKPVTTVTQDNECPGCNKTVNAATGTDGVSVPSQGDLSICFNCGTLLVFNEDLTVRILELEELVLLDQTVRDELNQIQNAVRGVKNNHH